MPVNCGPRGLPTGFVQLFRNNGDGTFTDVSKQSGVAAAAGAYPMTAVAADYDNDGWPDIYVACDSTPSWLFRNQHDGTFRQEGLERGAALSEDGLEQAGMGVAVGDYDLDGSLDIFKTHFADDTNVLYRNDGKGNFDDVTIRAGIGVETRYVGWGAGMADLDNDGFPDMFMVTGSVYPEVERSLPAYPFRTPRLVFRNLGDGRFEELIEEAGAGVAAAHTSRGCAFGDFDNDGDVDVLVMNMNEPPSLLRNDVSGSGHWLKVLLVGVKSNRSAIGARVTARYGGRTQAQEVSAQSSFYSANDRRLHFGLGERHARRSDDPVAQWGDREDSRCRSRPPRGHSRRGRASSGGRSSGPRRKESYESHASATHGVVSRTAAAGRSRLVRGGHASGSFGRGCVERLKGYHYAFKRLHEIFIARITAEPIYELKMAFSLHAYLCAEHVAALRQRVGEMREPPLGLEQVPAPALRVVFDEILAAPTTEELLLGIYEKAVPALRRALEHHLADTNPLADAPSVRVCRSRCWSSTT